MPPTPAVDRLPVPARRALAVAVATVRGLLADRGTMLAAAIAYNVLFSLFPLVLALVAVSGFVLRDAAVRDDAIARLEEALPLSGDGRDAIATALRTAAGGATTATLVAIPGLLWSASGMMGAMRSAVDAALGPDGGGRGFLRGKLIDLAFVLGVGVLALASLVLTVVGQKADEVRDLSRDWPDPLPSLVDALAGSAVPVLVVAASAAVFAILYRVLPARPPGRGALAVGVLVATLAFEILKRGFAYYVTGFANYASVYGSLGAVIAFLFFVYVAALILIVGAEAAAAFRDLDAEPQPAGLADAAPHDARRPPPRLAAAGVLLLGLAALGRLTRRPR